MKHRLTAAALIAAALTLTGCTSTTATEADPLGNFKGDKTNCTVTDKQAIGRVEVDDDGSRYWTDYRVFTSCGVFGVQDDMWIGQWNSADTYGSIEIGKTYDFEAYGWRNGFMSTFPNIKTATEVPR